MTALDDNAVLLEYTRANSEEAFATIVSRHVNKVYSVALRHTGSPSEAEEITQVVFVILARKAGNLGKGVVLSGWLYHTARLTALTYIRSETRRARREQEAQMDTLVNESPSDLWLQIAPLLDAAMADLNEADRNAVVLRYFDGKSIKEISTAIGATEEAVRMRLSRATGKLQRFFFKRGVTSTAQTLCDSVSANSVQVAPAALAKTVTAVALAKGVTASLSTSTLIKGALKAMAWTKAKTAIIAGAAAVAAAGTITVAYNTWLFNPSVNDVFKHYDSAIYLNHAPSVVLLRPTQYANQGTWITGTSSTNGKDDRILGRNRSIAWVLGAAYGVSAERIVMPPDSPRGGFDYLVTAAANPAAALRDELKKQFGLAARTETVTTNVVLMQASSPAHPGLKLNRSQTDQATILGSEGEFVLTHNTMLNLAEELGGYTLDTPIIDETGLTNAYDITIRWDPKVDFGGQFDVVNQTLQNQLGLELVPAKRAIEMLFVEYTNGPSDYTPRAGSDLQGYWKGSELWGKNPWPVVLEITEPSTGQFRALFKNVWFNSDFQPASSVTYDPPKVRIEFPTPDRIFEGELNNSHTVIQGTLSYVNTNDNGPGHPMTVTLTDPKIDAATEPQRDYRNTGPDDLAGHWTATAEDHSVAMDIAHLQNGSLTASLSLPGWPNAIDDTRIQTSPEVRIEWGYRRIATFRGQIENGKLVGTLQENRRGKPYPISFVRE
jgi:uncharacterized protein (TIGR03435 family)